jgi:hypothetical protein
MQEEQEKNELVSGETGRIESIKVTVNGSTTINYVFGADANVEDLVKSLGGGNLSEEKKQELIEELTPEQEEALYEHRDMWLDKVFGYKCYNNFNEERAVKAIKKIYQYCDAGDCDVVVMGSPMGIQQYLNTLNRKNDPNAKTRYFDFSSYVNYSDFGWLSFYEYFLKHLNLIQDKREELEMMIDAVECSFMSVQLEGLCVISKYPTFIARNENNDMNSVDGPAIKFEDGFELYYINGFEIEKEMFDMLSEKKVTFEMFTKEENEEVKSAILSFYQQKFGDEYLFLFLSDNMKEVDTYVDKKDPKYLVGTTGGMNIGVYTLFKGIVNGFNVAYVRCYCPSTDRMFFLGVEPDTRNAKDGIASLYRIPRMLENHIEAIHRQGKNLCPFT